MTDSKVREQQGQTFAMLYFLAIVQATATILVMGWSGLWALGPVVILAVYFAGIMKEKEVPL